MAGFKTHITASTVLGIGYGAAANLVYLVPLETCVLAGGMCSVSGMIPDLDSDSGVPVRETVALVAATTPMLMFDRFQHMHWSHETTVLVAAGIYLGVRFGVAGIFKRYTVHRGMWHSVPAMFIAGLLAFLVCSGENIHWRLFKSSAVMLGFFSHLLLDEIWSIEVRYGIPRFKKSFGTAIKFWSDSNWANFSTYAKLIVLAFIAVEDPVLMERFGYHPPGALQSARNFVESLIPKQDKIVR